VSSHPLVFTAGANPSPTPKPKSGGLSTGAKAGVAVVRACASPRVWACATPLPFSSPPLCSAR
jgi:hypothetical protein